VQDELLTLPLEFCFGLILVTFISTTLNSEIKRLVARVVNIPVTAMWLDGNSCRTKCGFPCMHRSLATASRGRGGTKRSADSLVRAKLPSGKKHADKAVRAPEKSPPEATMLGDSTATEVRLRYAGTTE
jgi:hypothetical protein